MGRLLVNCVKSCFDLDACKFAWHSFLCGLTLAMCIDTTRLNAEFLYLKARPSGLGREDDGLCRPFAEVGVCLQVDTLVLL